MFLAMELVFREELNIDLQFHPSFLCSMLCILFVGLEYQFEVLARNYSLNCEVDNHV